MTKPADFDFSDLSSAERLLIAEQLLDSMFDRAHGEGFTPAQLQEMQSRIQAADDGQMKRIAWDEARRQLGTIA